LKSLNLDGQDLVQEQQKEVTKTTSFAVVYIATILAIGVLMCFICVVSCIVCKRRKTGSPSVDDELEDPKTKNGDENGIQMGTNDNKV